MTRGFEHQIIFYIEIIRQHPINPQLQDWSFQEAWSVWWWEGRSKLWPSRVWWQMKMNPTARLSFKEAWELPPHQVYRNTSTTILERSPAITFIQISHHKSIPNMSLGRVIHAHARYLRGFVRLHKIVWRTLGLGQTSQCQCCLACEWLWPKMILSSWRYENLIALTGSLL